MGEYPNVIQGDNRVPIPSQFLKNLGGVGSKVIVTDSPDRCLLLFPAGSLEEIEEILGKNFHSEIVAIQSAGRIPVSNGLKAYAGLEKEVIFAGCINYIEIWNRASWDSQRGRLTKERSAALEKMWQ